MCSLQKKMQELGLDATPEEFVEGLPAPVKRRVHALQELQDKHEEIEEQFRKERAELEAKYEKLYGECSGIIPNMQSISWVRLNLKDCCQERICVRLPRAGTGWPISRLTDVN